MKAIRLFGKEKIWKNELSHFTPVYRNNKWHSLKVLLVNIDISKPKEGEILLAPQFCGLCGSDFSACRTSPIDSCSSFRGPLKLPVTIGHEFSAKVVDNNGCQDFKTGDLVVVESIIACGRCRNCRAGHRNSCTTLDLLGLTKDGGLAEYVCVPVDACWNISHLKKNFESEEMLLLSSSLIEMFGVAYNALFCSRANFFPGCVICVHGLGTLGLATCYLAALSGASLIFVVENDLDRIKYCKKILSLKTCLKPLSKLDTNEMQNTISNATNGYGIDIHIMCDGHGESLPSYAIETMAANGSIILLSRGDIIGNLATDRIIDQRGGILGIRGQSSYDIYGRLLSLMTSRILEPNKLITNIITLEQGVKILSDNNLEGKNLGKTVVKINGRL